MPARSGTSYSSMHTRASFGSSIIESSPIRQSPTRNGSRNHRASVARDPYESPSRQMQLEFNLKLSISDRNFNEQLDQAAAERARLHEEQLARAAEEHAKVRRGAELELQRLTLEEEKARLRSQEEQQRAIEQLQKEKAQQQVEAQRRQLEAQRREEELVRQAEEHQRKLQEAEARQKAQKEQEAAAERQRKAKEEEDRRAKEAAEAVNAAEKARVQQVAQQVAQQPQTQAAPAVAAQPTIAAKVPTAAQAPNDAINNIHTKYLELHKRMKEFRVTFWNQNKKAGQPLKEPIGNARRNLRLKLGQINVARATSQAAIKSLRTDSFDIALNTPGPMIDIRPFLVNQTIPPLANEAEAQYPAFLLYMWIMFEKFLLKQFEKEASNEDGRIIQELGLIAASLFADQKYMWKGISLIDVLLAKMHHICPIMFGIRGNMNTVEGQKRLGWMPIDKQPATGEIYMQRIRGLSAGFAAMSLRAFKTVPALPMSEFWRCVVHVCNTPPADLYPGHFAILNGLLRDFYKKFLAFYGVQARGVLRRAVVDLPARAPERCRDAAGIISVFQEQWKKENVYLN
ncbi:GLE1-like protein [Stagonosporopsis vannaccii]|nr:GLE1-like protein [Stagonosporopsis vannaccii]